jgi:hypothetical protein
MAASATARVRGKKKIVVSAVGSKKNGARRRRWDKNRAARVAN